MREDDLTARARIRDAAVRCFGEQGFGVSVRAIAAEAGVSPALVIHHFGSKDSLREHCDEHVLAEVRHAKGDLVTSQRRGWLVEQLAEVEEYAPYAAYIVRSLQSGGELARRFVDHMIADTEDYLAAGVSAGTVRPSRDPRARARALILQNVGAMLVHLALEEPTPGIDGFRVAMRELSEAMILPVLEIYADGLLTDRRLLDEYLMYVTDPPGSARSDGEPS